MSKKKQYNLKFFKKTLKYVWDWNTPKNMTTSKKQNCQHKVMSNVWFDIQLVTFWCSTTIHKKCVESLTNFMKKKQKNTHNENPKIKWKLKQFKNCCYAFFYGLFYNTMTRNEIKLEKNDTMKIKFQKNTKKKLKKYHQHC